MKWVVVPAVVGLLWLWDLPCPALCRDIGEFLKGLEESLAALSVDMYLSLCNLFAGISVPHEDRRAENVPPPSERHRTHVRIIKINISRLFNFSNMFKFTVNLNMRGGGHFKRLRHSDESGRCEEGPRRPCVRRRRPVDPKGGRGGR